MLLFFLCSDYNTMFHHHTRAHPLLGMSTCQVHVSDQTHSAENLCNPQMHVFSGGLKLAAHSPVEQLSLHSVNHSNFLRVDFMYYHIAKWVHEKIKGTFPAITMLHPHNVPSSHHHNVPYSHHHNVLSSHIHYHRMIMSHSHTFTICHPF